MQEVFALQGWTAETLGKDYGEDLLVRIFDDGEATPYTFYVQAKSMESISRHSKKGGKYVRYPVDFDHLGHWMEFWDPVFLAIWERGTGGVIWEMIQEPSLPIDMSGAKAKIIVPRRNALDVPGLLRMRTQTVSRHRRLKREERGSEVLLDLLSESMNAKVSCDSQAGILVIEHHDGDMSLQLFGATLKLMEWIAKKRNTTVEQAFGRAIRWGAEAVRSIQAGVPYERQNADGSIAVYRTVEEWARCADIDDYVGWVEEMPDE